MTFLCRLAALRHFFILLTPIALLNSNLSSIPTFASEPINPVVLYTHEGKHTLKLEIATTPQARERGLMYRTSLNGADGMLFIFPEPFMITMWMKNTPISLDMVFLDKTGKVVDISEWAEPYSTGTISSKVPAKGVIEMAGGRAKQLGITLGDRIEYEAFSH